MASLSRAGASGGLWQLLDRAAGRQTDTSKGILDDPLHHSLPLTEPAMNVNLVF
jgi:hypothetical protein